MRREVIECNNCPHEIEEKPVPVVLHEMRVTVDGKPMILASEAFFCKEGERNVPDFCGVPCLLKWINNKITGGIGNGNQSE